MAHSGRIYQRGDIYTQIASQDLSHSITPEIAL